MLNISRVYSNYSVAKETVSKYEYASKRYTLLGHNFSDDS